MFAAEVKDAIGASGTGEAQLEAVEAEEQNKKWAGWGFRLDSDS